MNKFITAKLQYNIKLFYIILSFSSLWAGCQTFNIPDAEEKQRLEVLNTQKSVIVSFLNKGLPEMAIKELRPLIAKYPEDADFKNLMGLGQLAIKNPKEAIRYFQASYKVLPRTSVALNLSSAYIEAGQYDKSIEILTLASKSPDLDAYPHPERITHNLGLAAERAKKYKSAEKFYLKALSQNPGFFISQMRLGQLYEKLNKPERAEMYFSQAKTNCPNCFDPISALTYTYLQQGAKNKALSTIRGYLKNRDLSPQDRVRATELLSLAQKADQVTKGQMKQ